MVKYQVIIRENSQNQSEKLANYFWQIIFTTFLPANTLPCFLPASPTITDPLSIDTVIVVIAEKRVKQGKIDGAKIRLPPRLTLAHARIIASINVDVRW